MELQDVAKLMYSTVSYHNIKYCTVQYSTVCTIPYRTSPYGMGSEVVTGGPWTRVDPATGGQSCLDLFVVSRELRPYVSELKIDNKRMFTATRVVKKKDNTKLVYSDHLSCLLTFTNIPRVKEVKEEKRTVWNLRKENGWIKYKEVTDEYSETIRKVVMNKEVDIENVMNKFEKIHNKIKFKAFGKVTLGGKKNNNCEEESEETSNLEIDAKLVLDEQVRKAKEEIGEICKTTNGKVGKIWQVRTKVMGKKKSEIEAASIINPKTNKLVVSKSEIKR